MSRRKKGTGSIYKAKWKVKKPDGTVEVRESRNYTIAWVDARGKKKRMVVGPWETQAAEVLAKKLAEVIDQRCGIRRIDLSRTLLTGLQTSYLSSLEPHVTGDHLKEVKSSLEKLLAFTGAVFVPDLDREGAEAYLKHLERNGRALGSRGPKTGSGGRTLNKHLRFWKGFLNWCVQERKMPFSPLAGIKPRKETKKRRVRRVLNEEEKRRLLDASRRPKAREWEFPAYCLALYAALRQGDIDNLERRDIDLRARRMTIRAEVEKSRRGAAIPIHPVLAKVLAEWLAAHPGLPSSKVIVLSDHPVEVLKATLAAAGVPYKDDNGHVADWHALRHTCLTNAYRGKRDPKAVQALARHADFKLTMDTYVHGDEIDVDVVSAVESLPDLTAPAANKVKEGATGRECPTGIGPRSAPCQAVDGDNPLPGKEIARRADGILSPARLPVPPLRHRLESLHSGPWRRKARQNARIAFLAYMQRSATKCTGMQCI